MSSSMRPYAARWLAAVMAAALCAAFVAEARGEAGIKSFHAEALNRDGSVDTRAGSHPYAYTVRFEFNQDSEGNAEGSVRDIAVTLPSGLAGNPLSLPRCAQKRFEGLFATCPGDTQIGRFKAVSRDPLTKATLEPAGAIYNLVPPAGTVASFGFSAAGFVARLNISVVDRGAEQRVSVVTSNVPLAYITDVTATVWGVPEEASHDSERICFENGNFVEPCESDVAERPLVTLPPSCEGPSTAILEADFVEFPGPTEPASSPGPALNRCEALEFKPTVEVQTERTGAAEPTGLSVGVHLPQGEAVGGVSEADIREAVITLPPGIVANPAVAGGLEACSSAQIQLGSDTKPSCPSRSEIGTVEVHTPVIDHPLPGQVYLAAQNDNKFGSLLAIYLVVDDPATGVIVKLAGHVEPDPVTGQLKTTFPDLPELPFEEVAVNLSGGPRAPLMNPPTCGQELATSLLTPSTSPYESPVAGSNVLAITAGVNGCALTPAEEPNDPSFSAGTSTPIAGAYSPFVLRLARQDGSQTLSTLSVTMPPGLIGKLAGIPRCTDAQIAIAQAPGHTGRSELANPSCPAASQVGTGTTGLGAGGYPYYITAPVYLAGPYEGAPFSLAIIAPAVAGPYDLGTVVVRVALHVDPQTAQVTATSDPIPSILQGLPTDVRSIAVNLDHPEFTLNPTSCDVMSIVGDETSTLGATAPLDERFQVGGCSTLSFAPTFTATTSGMTSKRTGAPLTITVTHHAGEANIHSTILQLPVALPSRDETLQQACTDEQFALNVAGCPLASRIGSARVVTPVLNEPLTGPAYLVSHGGAAFPDVVFMLEGEGVKIDVTAHTDIKNGVTYSKLETVPDAPFTTFEATFPQGPASIFGAIGNLCAQALHLHVTAVGQNGMRSITSPLIAVKGCPRAKLHARAKRTGHGVALVLTSSQPGRVTIVTRGASATRNVSAGTHTIYLTIRHPRSNAKIKITLRTSNSGITTATTRIP